MSTHEASRFVQIPVATRNQKLHSALLKFTFCQSFIATRDSLVSHQNQLRIHQSTTTVAMMIPANLNTATLFPWLAMTPSLRALPLMLVVMFEKDSEVLSMTCWSRALS
jgi:hypothetical protein